MQKTLVALWFADIAGYTNDRADGFPWLPESCGDVRAHYQRRKIVTRADIARCYLPYYWYLDPARQEEFDRNIEALAKWIEGAIQRFRSGVKNSRVIELHDTNHYVFVVDEALVVREMRKFLIEESRCLRVD